VIFVANLLVVGIVIGGAYVVGQLVDETRWPFTICLALLSLSLLAGVRLQRRVDEYEQHEQRRGYYVPR